MLAVIAMYMLATRTNFFAQGFKDWKDIMKNEDILFLAELMTKNLDIAEKNAFGVRVRYLVTNQFAFYNLKVITLCLVFSALL